MGLVRGSLPWRPAWSLAPQTVGLLRAICSLSWLCRSVLLSRLAGGAWLMVPGLRPACGCLSYHCPCRGLHHVTPHQPPGSELRLGLELGFVLRPLLHPPTSSPPSGLPPALFPCLHSCDPLVLAHRFCHQQSPGILTRLLLYLFPRSSPACLSGQGLRSLRAHWCGALGSHPLPPSNSSRVWGSSWHCSGPPWLVPLFLNGL